MTVLATIFLFFLVVFVLLGATALTALLTDWKNHSSPVLHSLGETLAKAAPYATVGAVLTLLIIVLLGFVLAIAVLV
jgi:hypothetical protein